MHDSWELSPGLASNAFLFEPYVLLDSGDSGLKSFVFHCSSFVSFVFTRFA